MKTKVLLSIAFIFFGTTVANAQINDGRYLLGGSISYTHQNDAQNSNYKNSYFYSNIQFGKVLKDNTVAGIILSYGNGNSDNNISNKASKYGAGVFYRKYKSVAKGFYLFGEADALYSYTKNTQGNFQIGNNGTRYISNLGSLSFTPGLSYSIFKRVQIELIMQDLVSLSYGVSKNEATNIGSSTISSAKSNNFSASINVNSSLVNNFGIGFKFLLGK